MTQTQYTVVDINVFRAALLNNRAAELQTGGNYSQNEVRKLYVQALKLNPTDHFASTNLLIETINSGMPGAVNHWSSVNGGIYLDENDQQTVFHLPGATDQFEGP